MFIGHAKTNSGLKTSGSDCNVFSITSISSKLPRVKARSFNNQTKISELAGLETAGGLPGAFTASPASQMLPVVWYWDFSRLIFWFFFFGASLLVGLFCFAWLQTVVHAEFRQPLRETRGLSRAQVGDVITAVIPLTWSITMLMHASAHSSNFDETTTGTFFTIQILGYQWGWNYYLPMDLLSEWNSLPIEVGHGAWVQPQISQSYDLLLARSRSEYWRRFAARGEWASANGRFSVATASAVFAAPQNVKSKFTSNVAILPQKLVTSLTKQPLNHNQRDLANYTVSSKSSDLGLAMTQYYRTSTQTLPTVIEAKLALPNLDVVNLDIRLRQGYSKQLTRSVISLQNVSNRLTLIHKWLQPCYGLVIKEWRGHNSQVTKHLLINKLMLNTRQGVLRSLQQAPNWSVNKPNFVGTINLSNFSPRTTSGFDKKANWSSFSRSSLQTQTWLASSVRNNKAGKIKSAFLANQTTNVFGAKLGAKLLISSWIGGRPNTESSKGLITNWADLSKQLAISFKQRNLVNALTNDSYLASSSLVKLQKFNKFLIKQSRSLLNTSLNNNQSKLTLSTYGKFSSQLNFYTLYNQNLQRGLITISGKPNTNSEELLRTNSAIFIKQKADLGFKFIVNFPKLSWFVKSKTTNTLTSKFSLLTETNSQMLRKPDSIGLFIGDIKSFTINSKLRSVLSFYQGFYLLRIFDLINHILKTNNRLYVFPTIKIIGYLKPEVKILFNFFWGVNYYSWLYQVKPSLYMISSIALILNDLVIIAGAFHGLTIVTRLLIIFSVIKFQNWLFYLLNKSLFVFKLLIVLAIIHVYIFAIADIHTYNRHGIENFIILWKIEISYWWMVLATLLMDTAIAIVLTLAKWLIYIVTFLIIQSISEIYTASKGSVITALKKLKQFIIWSSAFQSNLLITNIKLVIWSISRVVLFFFKKLLNIHCYINLRKEIVTNVWVTFDLHKPGVTRGRLILTATQCYNIIVTKNLINKLPMLIRALLNYNIIGFFKSVQVQQVNLDKYSLKMVKIGFGILCTLFKNIILIYIRAYLRNYNIYCTPYLYYKCIVDFVISRIFKFLIYAAIVPVYAPLAKLLFKRYLITRIKHFAAPTTPIISINEIFMISWDFVINYAIFFTLLMQYKNQLNTITNISTIIFSFKLANLLILASCKTVLNKVTQTINSWKLSVLCVKLIYLVGGIHYLIEKNRLTFIKNKLILRFIVLLKFSYKLTTLQLAPTRFFIKNSIAVCWSCFNFCAKLISLTFAATSVNPVAKRLTKSNSLFTFENRGMPLVASAFWTQVSQNSICVKYADNLVISLPQLNNQLEHLGANDFVSSVETTGIAQNKLVDSIEREQVAARITADSLPVLQTVELIDWKFSWYLEAALETQPTERLYHSVIARRPQTGIFSTNLIGIENSSARDIQQLRATIAGLGNNWHQSSQSKFILRNKQLRITPAVLDTEAFNRISVFAKVTPQPGLDLDPAFLTQKWSKDFTVSRTVDHTQRYRSIWGPLFLALRVSPNNEFGSHSFRKQGGHEAVFLPWPKRAAKHALSHWSWQRYKTAVNPTSDARLNSTSINSLGLSLTKAGPLSTWGVLWTQAPSNSRNISFIDSNLWWSSEIKLALARWETLGLLSVNRGTLLNQLYVTRVRGWLNNSLLFNTALAAPSSTNELKSANISQAYLPLTERLGNARRLRVTARFCLPSDTAIHAIFSARDVIHTWNVPLLNVKVDCIPGFSSHRRLLFRWRGFAVGQCAEVCGRYHHQMAIAVDIVSPHLFIRWVAAHMQTADNAAASDRKLPGLPNPRWLAAALCAELSTAHKLI